MRGIRFPDEFMWGVSASAYQIEGAWAEDGKGESIWDRFCHIPGNVANGDTGDIACDHYHRYKDDIALMRQLGIRFYRFSISWPRIQPYGHGKINQKGIKFYNDLINCMLENGIQPFAVLYHWDLPQALQNKGGWANRETAEYFKDYARIVFNEFGDRVRHWITILEPQVIAYNGNWMGNMAPGIRDFSTALEVSHNLMRGHGLAVREFKKMGLDGKIGIINMHPKAYPASNSSEDMAAANRFDGAWCRWYLDPLCHGHYPDDMMVWYQSHGVVLPEIIEDDMDLISTPIDFMGINYYTSKWFKEGNDLWPLMIEKAKPPVEKFTMMDWAIYPLGFYHSLMRVSENYKNEIIVMENGGAFNDIVSEDGEINDVDRIEYLRSHITAMHQAIKEGANVKGYFIWSILDNFEWAYGCQKRFGLIYVDYKDQKRIIKRSGHLYRNVMEKNGIGN